MSKRVLLVGLEYDGPTIEGVDIEMLGLCRSAVDDTSSAFALYEYDVIVINPQSYSHFIFGRQTEHSKSAKELWDLKSENNDYDLDSAYDEWDRSKELDAALEKGTRVVWVLNPDKRVSFFGQRSLYSGYASPPLKTALSSCTIHIKKSRQISIHAGAEEFVEYFEALRHSGWRICISDTPQNMAVMATTPEGYCLGAKFSIGNSVGWLVTAPTDVESRRALIRCAIGSGTFPAPRKNFHGLFLSHTSEDKPFVRKLREDLIRHGVEDVWLDEAEIQIGDSLTKKISEALARTRYVGVVLSPRSIRSPWVEKELEAAMTREISTGEVVVLPMLYERCELPPFLVGKMYADLTTDENYQEGLGKLLRRLKCHGET